MLTDRKIAQLMTRFLTREAGELEIFGVVVGEAIQNWYDEEVVPTMTHREVALAEVFEPLAGVVESHQGDRAVANLVATQAPRRSVDRTSPEHREFDRRAEIRRSLQTVFDFSNELIDASAIHLVSFLREQIVRTGNCDSIHNGNKAVLKALLKTHPISNVEQMRLDEMKIVAVALMERDEVTIQTIVDTARRRRNG